MSRRGGNSSTADVDGDAGASTSSSAAALASGSRVAAFEQVLRERNFWLIFSVCFIGMGSGITLINNIGGLVLSLGGARGQQDTYVVLISVGSCVGRAGAGLASDQFKRWPRANYLLANSLLMALAQLSLCIPNLSSLYLSCFLTGVSFGAYFSLMPVILGDFFAGSDFGKVLGAAMMAPTLGSLVFSTFLASTFYKWASPAHAATCVGPACFRATWFVLAASSFLAAQLSRKIK